MNKLKISPGEWICDNAHVHAGESCIIYQKGWGTIEEAQANARLLTAAPKLYDRLKEAAYEFCHNCLSLRLDREEDIPSSEELIERNCPLQDNGCFCRKWWDTLKEAGVEE